jgi:hypothetical protein
VGRKQSPAPSIRFRYAAKTMAKMMKKPNDQATVGTVALILAGAGLRLRRRMTPQRRALTLHLGLG